MNEYLKFLESLMIKVIFRDETNETKVARFRSGLRRDIQNIVQLYSSLENVLHLTLKIEA